MTTQFHSQYYAYELTRRLASDNVEKLSQSLLNATVDLNPHQVEAALFAFRSPLSRGAILADEVGLGKTIEAGLIVSQLWVERKRSILCIVPANLRKQWDRELLEKFFLESTILESRNFKTIKNEHGTNPFRQLDRIVICSYEFARSRMDEVQQVSWDLVILDEAHRLRNVYKKDNKIARAIRDAVHARPKVLLTATPLQNSLMELFGLVSFVDPHLFGDEESFRSQYATRPGTATNAQLQSLKQRIQPICQRTLRRQVAEYVPYTNRISFTQDFTPTEPEVRLYEVVSNYLQKEELIALPSSQRQLITLILRKILASSSFAISATLGTLINRLEGKQAAMQKSVNSDVTELVGDDLEHANELQEEWRDDDVPVENGQPIDPEVQASLLRAIRSEISELKSYKDLAGSITVNAKGDALLTALQVGFKKAAQLGSPRKVLLFTESRRTQTYLKELLEHNGYAGQIVTFNGTNTDPESKHIYSEWLKTHVGEDCISGSPSADMRAALVDHFRNHAAIMIATESAAEGVNLQFCNVVVNYDLPWNPQRIEQRIGRCHRYGQKFDVVVINFLNRKNEADQRVFQLLDQKFKLFNGVFGASDEVLGSLETGVDFEKRIFQIYQQCRTSAAIKLAFDDLQQELEDRINARIEHTRTTLMENFDEEVHEKLRVREKETKNQVSRYERWLWQLTKSELDGHADFNDEQFTFRLLTPPNVAGLNVALGTYGLVTHHPAPATHQLRFDHPLVAAMLNRAKSRDLQSCEMIFDHSSYRLKVSLAQKHEGTSGWLRVSLFSVTALEVEEHLILNGITEAGEILPGEECAAFFSVPGATGLAVVTPVEVTQKLDEVFDVEQNRLLLMNEERNLRFFAEEEDKLDRWAEDLKESLERELKEIAADIRAMKRDSRLAQGLEQKVAFQKRIRDTEKRQSEKRKRLFEAQDEVDQKRDALIAATQARLKQSVESRHLFTIRWSVK